MYYCIHSMKKEGFSKRQIAERLELDFRTVSKYLSMTADEFNERVLKKDRQRDLDLYEGVVTDWLRRYPDMSAAQVLDWLKEHYQVTTAERTVRRFVAEIRGKYSIPKAKEAVRQYAVVEELPMGRQMQVDIGEAWVLDTYKRKHVKLYCVAGVLSHSRYKCGVWYAKPLNAREFIRALQICFEDITGIPAEIVFDQDRLLAVDENYGDIIFTKEFEQFRLSSGFEVYLCRKNDPESKGKIEAVVKYFKKNFAKNRHFVDIDSWNESFGDWLLRTGNARKNDTTKRVPAEVFEQERLLLKPVPGVRKVYENIVTRDVHKNNTIFYEGNRYTLPLGTYMPGMKVSLEIACGKLIIIDAIDGDIIAKHDLSKNKGELVSNSNHKRDTSTKLDALQDNLLKQFDGAEDAEVFLTQIRLLKPRHARDQFILIKQVLDNHHRVTIENALNYSMTHSLFSAVEFRNAAEYFRRCMEAETEQALKIPNVIVLSAKAAAVSKKRDLAEYAKALKGVDY